MLNLLPILRRNVELNYLLLSTHRDRESFNVVSRKVMQSTAATIEVSVVMCSVLCLVNWLAWTLLKRFAFLFSSINKLLFIRQNCMSCEEIPSSENSDKPASSILICSRKHCFERIKVSDSKSLHKKWRCLNTIKSCFTFKIIDTRIFSYFQKVLTLTLWQNTQFTTVILFCFIFTS